MSIAARIAQRINPVRETAISPSTRFVTKLEAIPIRQLAMYVCVPSVIGFGVLAMIERPRTMHGWRFLAHVGPYQVPALLSENAWRSSLEKLGDTLTSSEISENLANVEVISQRKLAVREIVKSEGFGIFWPVFLNFKRVANSQSNFETNMRIAMDLVMATPAQKRHVSSEIIDQILDLQCIDNRFPEYRLLLLLKLLQNPENLREAKKNKKLENFLAEQDKLALHSPYPALPLMPLLYQLKTEKLGFETFDIIRKIRTMLGHVSLPNKDLARRSWRLDWKLDFENFEKLVYLTICYASIRILPMISEYSFPVLKSAAFVMAKSVMGVALLDLWYRAEEHIIQSRTYFEAAKKSFPQRLMGPCFLVAAHCGWVVFVLRRFPFCFAPFMVTKMVRDSFSDAYRFS